MRCPNPNCSETEPCFSTIETRQQTSHIRRRRQCLCCGHRFTTIEMIPETKIVKGRAQDYVMIDKVIFNKVRSKAHILRAIVDRLVRELTAASDTDISEDFDIPEKGSRQAGSDLG